jgi:YHS domain-containing protein
MKTPQASRLITLLAAAALLFAAGKSMAAGCAMEGGKCSMGAMSASCGADHKTTTTAAATSKCPFMSAAASAAQCPRMVAEAATDDPVKIGKTAKAADAKTSAAYPLDACPVTGQKLGKMGEPFIYNYKGREVRFCCQGCVKSFEKDSAKFLKQMDEAIVKAQKQSYPLTTCVVSGDKLGGEMGAPVDYVYKNQLVRFCCSGCVKKFQKDPAKYLKQISDAKAKAEAKKTAAAK